MGLFRRSYTHLDKTSLRSLINSLVRPHLEYCVSIWYPLLKKDEELIENILHQATKIISGLYDKPYKECLAAIKVPSMRYHRMRDDIKLVYKILHGDNQSLRDLFKIKESGQEVITLNFINHSFKRQYVNIFLVWSCEGSIIIQLQIKVT